jgi:hypothetical protein
MATKNINAEKIQGNLSITSVSATTYYNLPKDIRVTGGTYSNGIATFTNNTGGTFNVNGFYTNFTGGTVSGDTIFNGNVSANTLNITNNAYANNFIDAATVVTTTNGTTILTNNSTRLQIFVGNSVQTVQLPSTSGLTIGTTYEINNNTTNKMISIIDYSGNSITSIYAGAYVRLTLTSNISLNGTWDVHGYMPSSASFANTGLTVNGNIVGNSISATTYQNLPLDIRVTGGTYSNGSATFTNNTGGTFTVTGFKTGDTFVTGGTYSNNTFTFTNNTGGTYSVLFNTVTGLTINGNLSVTGNTSLNGLTANTISATTYLNTPYWTSGSSGNYSIKAKNNSSIDSTGSYTLAEGYNTTAQGDYSHAEGYVSIANGSASHSEGTSTIAQGDYSHAEGYSSTANGFASHAEGTSTTAQGDYSHAEGTYTTAQGNSSHAEGYASTAQGDYSHAEGNNYNGDNSTPHIAYGLGSHIEGTSNISRGDNNHTEGSFNYNTGFGSHIEGINNFGSSSIVFKVNAYDGGGSLNIGGDVTSFFNINDNIVLIDCNGVVLDAEYTQYFFDNQILSLKYDGANTSFNLYQSITCTPCYVVNVNTNIQKNSHIEGSNNRSYANTTHLEGSATTAYSAYSHTEGYATTTHGEFSHAEGLLNVIAGQGGHVEGSTNIGGVKLYSLTSYDTSKVFSSIDLTPYFNVGDLVVFVDGNGVTLPNGLTQYYTQNRIISINWDGVQTIIEYADTFDTLVYTPVLIGNLSTNNTDYTHTEGYKTTASGNYSHAEGYVSAAHGDYSHAEGTSTTARSTNSHAGGYNSIASGQNSFVHGSGSTASGTNTVVLGGGITGTTDNTVFVPYMNIKYLSGGTSTINLGIDANGYVVVGTTGSNFTGGTVTGATYFSNGLSANTFSATTYLGLPIDIRVTGGTYTSGTATFTNNTGGTFSVSGFNTTVQGITGLTGGSNISVTGANNSYTISFTGTTGSNFTGGTVTGATYFSNGLSANTFNATTYLGLPIDIRVTGGTYSNGTTTFTNNTGGTFSVSGFNTTVQGITGLTGGSNISVTGANNSYTISFTGTTGSNFTGGTVTGATYFSNGLSANTFTASQTLSAPLYGLIVNNATTGGLGGTTNGAGVQFLNNTGTASIVYSKTGGGGITDNSLNYTSDLGQTYTANGNNGLGYNFSWAGTNNCYLYYGVNSGQHSNLIIMNNNAGSSYAQITLNSYGGNGGYLKGSSTNSTYQGITLGYNATDILAAKYMSTYYGVGILTQSPNSSLQVSGSNAIGNLVTKSASYTLTATDCIVIVTATGTTQTLPTAVGITSRIYIIKLTASGSCTIATTSSQTIDGNTTYLLSAIYKYVQVVSDGANWLVIANN